MKVKHVADMTQSEQHEYLGHFHKKDNLKKGHNNYGGGGKKVLKPGKDVGKYTVTPSGKSKEGTY